MADELLPVARARPRLLDRIAPLPTRRQIVRRRVTRGALIGGGALLALILAALFVLVLSFMESRWTLPETSISARVEEDLYYNITYDPGSNDILGINYTTDELIHLGNPEGGIEGVQARVERNQTENRHSYQLKDDRDILVASSTEVLVSNRPFFDKTALVSHVENSFTIDPDSGARAKQYTAYKISGKRLHQQSSTTVQYPGGAAQLVNTVFENSEWWGWFGDRFRAGSQLVEFRIDTPLELVERFEREHRAWHAEQKMRISNPFTKTLDALRPYSRPIYRSDEGLPGPWWQLDTLPQGSNLHLFAAADGSKQTTLRIAWDKTGIFPWRWLNGGYVARDQVGELFRVQIRDYWLHFQNQLAYLYFLDLNGDGSIDRDTELIGQVYYKVADSPLRETFARNPNVPLTQENTQEFTRHKTFVFRVGSDRANAERDFLLCDAIEKLLPDAVAKGFGRDSHLGYIERARDDFLLSLRTDAERLHSAAHPEDALAFKDAVVQLLRAAQRPYAEELETYYFGVAGYPGYRQPAP